MACTTVRVQPSDYNYVLVTARGSRLSFLHLLSLLFSSIEWYRGTIMSINSNRDAYDVIYDDEEEDFGLCRRCVRQYEPFHRGEEVDVRADEGEEFEPGRIVAVYTNDDEEDDEEREAFLYDVRTQDGDLLQQMPPFSLRRFR